ncbi:uncharacterized protein LOC123411321 [Hordeum vulgare subsp. vulgare]|uniref:Uncharacterized protein n=1 Tax=Hordeum vulgare subsp. vulgare TaxID=112509 RepID=A0A8I6YYK7_HORVV|nr:uncharacterized protein LOC123411321 [Hordeum vulgare subsp. vulgare]
MEMVSGGRRRMSAPRARISQRTMKLLVDTRTGRVVYAEARKEVVDFLFSLLAIPISTVVGLLAADPIGSVGNLSRSLDDLDAAYIVDEHARDALLPPTAGGGGLLLLLTAGGSSFSRGVVQGVVTYTITDDLKVTPMSSISGITMLNNHRIRDTRHLQERTVQFGRTEGLEILRASLQSQTVLTDVFLRRA